MLRVYKKHPELFPPAASQQLQLYLKNPGEQSRVLALVKRHFDAMDTEVRRQQKTRDAQALLQESEQTISVLCDFILGAETVFQKLGGTVPDFRRLVMHECIPEWEDGTGVGNLPTSVTDVMSPYLPLNGGPDLRILLIERRMGHIPAYNNLLLPIVGPRPAPGARYVFPERPRAVALPGPLAPPGVPPGAPPAADGGALGDNNGVTRLPRGSSSPSASSTGTLVEGGTLAVSGLAALGHAAAVRDNGGGTMARHGTPTLLLVVDKGTGASEVVQPPPRAISVRGSEEESDGGVVTGVGAVAAAAAFVSPDGVPPRRRTFNNSSSEDEEETRETMGAFNGNGVSTASTRPLGKRKRDEDYD